MHFYIFNFDFDLISKLEDAGFTGTLFIYNTNESDYFTKIARDVDVHKKIKYMVAIRPHVISPEYLVRIHKSIQEISKDNRLQINLISGHMKPDEIDVVRTISEVSNKSTPVERSKYLIKYIELLSNLEERDKPDYYVSVTNQFTYDVAAKNNDKMIIGYSQYLQNLYDLKNKKVMISITPILRKTHKEIEEVKSSNIHKTSDLQMFTYDEMNDLVNELKNEGINEVIYSSWNSEDTEEIINFVKQYNHKYKGDMVL